MQSKSVPLNWDDLLQRDFLQLFSNEIAIVGYSNGQSFLMKWLSVVFY